LLPSLGGFEPGHVGCNSEDSWTWQMESRCHSSFEGLTMRVHFANDQ
jgi:hypothetical protein